MRGSLVLESINSLMKTGSEIQRNLEPQWPNRPSIRGECELSLGEIRAAFPTFGGDYREIINLILHSYDLRMITLADRATAGILYAAVGGRWMRVREGHIYMRR